jgi:hypothetical protein
MKMTTRSAAMKQRGWVIGVFAVLALSFVAVASAADNYRLINGTTEFYYGHISLADIKNDGKDPMVLREGATAAEPAALNLPLGPGDTIMTSGERRCEIQFDNGTTLRLDVDTELKIEALMAQSLSSSTKVSNLVLRRGRVYVMYKQYSSKELFQVITPNAGVKLAHNAVATVGWAAGGGTDVQVVYGRANVLYGPDSNALIEKMVYKNERMTIDPSHHAGFGTYVAQTEFETWNVGVNKNFDELHKGKTMIPKPVQRMNSAVFYFAQQFGNLYGDWIYDDYFGYVWRPFANDMRYPNGGWMPYYAGSWSEYNGQMYWVASEPWGWAPYHLGVWQWNAKRGWYWIPGSAFAPAWVDWAFFGGAYYGWRPWSMWDWGWYGDYGMGSWPMYGGMQYGFGNYYMGYMPFWQNYWMWRYPWAINGYYPNGYPGDSSGTGGYGSDGFISPVTKVSKDQLQKPGAAPFTMPKEFKSGLKSLIAALKKGDPNAVGSFQAVAKQTMVVGASDLHKGSMHTRAVPLDQFMRVAGSLGANSPQKAILSLPPRSAQNSAYNASRTFERNARISTLQSFVSGRSPAPAANDGAASASRAITRATTGVGPRGNTRARDWNPDIRIGLRAGLDIVYLSQRNEVYAPQLRISSSMAENHPVLTANGRARLGGNEVSGGGGGYSSGGSYSGGSSSSSGGSSSGSGSVSSSGGASSGGSSGGSSSSSGGGGRIRN